MQNKGAAGTKTQSGLEFMVTEQLGKGKTRTQVIRNLTQSGMTESEANQVVERIYFKLKKTVSEEEFSGGALVPAILGGLIAAIVSGVVWAAIAIWTGYEIGYVAWGVGLLCGMGVVMLSQGQRGLPLQIVAVAASVLGIVIGKYGVYQHFLQESLVGVENGAAVAAEFGLFSAGMIQLFMADLPEMTGLYDYLWFGLAVYSAWSIPKAASLEI